ncbi:hypothetical protein GCM10023116_18750 [Kistimonas scapharcae]|uniref:WGR domain-containing protein n=1 Tax=Kistimonas scapharcae TaxID=1036133 RepID=A0ABP8V114_9GAMM
MTNNKTFTLDNPDAGIRYTYRLVRGMVEVTENCYTRVRTSTWHVHVCEARQWYRNQLDKGYQPA